MPKKCLTHRGKSTWHCFFAWFCETRVIPLVNVFAVGLKCSYSFQAARFHGSVVATAAGSSNLENAILAAWRLRQNDDMSANP